MPASTIIIKARQPQSIKARIYERLLAQTLPTVIRTEKQNDKTLEVIWSLMQKGEANLSIEELELIELLSVLVERFEEKQYPIKDAPSHRILLHLLEARGLKQADLLPIFSSRGLVSDVVNGKRGISKAQAKKLGEFFHVSAALFL